MTAAAIQERLLKETEGLSFSALQEILDFVLFMKVKESHTDMQAIHAMLNLQNERHLLETASVAQLEEEFADYQERYPYESVDGQ